MAIVSVSLDTESRQAVLTINGVLIPTKEFSISQYEDYETGKLRASFGYTIIHIDGSGLEERRQFYLPSPEDVAAEVHGELNEDGFASKVVHDDEKAKADVIEFFKP